MKHKKTKLNVGRRVDNCTILYGYGIKAKKYRLLELGQAYTDYMSDEGNETMYIGQLLNHLFKVMKDEDVQYGDIKYGKISILSSACSMTKRVIDLIDKHEEKPKLYDSDPYIDTESGAIIMCAAQFMDIYGLEKDNDAEIPISCIIENSDVRLFNEDNEYIANLILSITERRV